MTLAELMIFIREQNAWLKRRYPDERKTKQRTLLRLAKITEEVGELAEQILGSLKQQRKKEGKKMDSDSVEEEIADVIVTTLLLAQVMKVDVERALRMKIKKILERRNN